MYANISIHIMLYYDQLKKKIVSKIFKLIKTREFNIYLYDTL